MGFDKISDQVTRGCDPLYVVRLPEIHAVGDVVGAIVAAEYGQLEQIQAKYSSMEVVSIDEYSEDVAEAIRSVVSANQTQENKN